jgi:stage II sporulation protein AB (anti-sigma F factor)
MNSENYMKIELKSASQNESVARVAVASFAALLDPTLDEIEDIKTAVSEAVTNSIVHGYGSEDGIVFITCRIEGNVIRIIVEDTGKGIPDVKKAMEPMFSTSSDIERSGMGFTVMESFMDSLQVTSEVGKGTRVEMTKQIQQ